MSVVQIRPEWYLCLQCVTAVSPSYISAVSGSTAVLTALFFPLKYRKRTLFDWVQESLVS